MCFVSNERKKYKNDFVYKGILSMMKMRDEINIIGELTPFFIVFIFMIFAK